jgi:4-hydroxy-tetrahydrodipicolinate reductase
MINVLLSGCNGKMGQVITRLAKEKDNIRIAAGYDINNNIINNYPVYTDLSTCEEKFDAIIDFSHPAALENILNFATKTETPLVLATTGLSEVQNQLAAAASRVIPIFYSANMSLGVSLIIDLVKRAAKTLVNDFDIEIIEKHHNQKIDAPSGTALAIADSINQVLDHKLEHTYERQSRRTPRSKNEIGIHAVRGGTIAGEHTVIFAGNDEIIEIKHTAISKDIFATGALKAAEFIYNKKAGMYSMDDVFGE